MSATTTAPRSGFLKPWHGCLEHNHNHCPACRSCDCHVADAHVRGMVASLDRKLDFERAFWVATGAPAECVRPAGEAFGWRQGSGPCDCPPCLHAAAQAHSSEGD